MASNSQGLMRQYVEQVQARQVAQLNLDQLVAFVQGFQRVTWDCLKELDLPRKQRGRLTGRLEAGARMVQRQLERYQSMVAQRMSTEQIVQSMPNLRTTLQNWLVDVNAVAVELLKTLGLW